MTNHFPEEEQLYRAVYPPEVNKMFWKDDNHVSSAAFLDKKGLSVERGNFRSDKDVVNDMRKNFMGAIVSITVKLCHQTDATVLYKPTKRSIYHSEIHGTTKNIVLNPNQRRFLSENCCIVKENA